MNAVYTKIDKSKLVDFFQLYPQDMLHDHLGSVSFLCGYERMRSYIFLTVSV